jgi:anti-anti-sigma factor
MSPSNRPRSDLRLDIRSEAGSRIIDLRGVLDAASYLPLRDRILKCATEQPKAIVIDVDALRIAAESALVVFTSARWQIAQWPDVPLVLISQRPAMQSVLRRNGVTRYVPCYDTLESALAAIELGDPGPARRTMLQLPVVTTSGTAGRRFVRDTLERWGLSSFRGTAQLVATELIENAVRFAAGAQLTLRLEYRKDRLTIAVGDDSNVMPVRRELPEGTRQLSGLAVVTQVCRTWGSLPRQPNGKVVWAVIGPENAI